MRDIRTKILQRTAENRGRPRGKRMLTIYLSHPFTGNESENRERARAYAAEITRKRSDILIVNPLDAMIYAGFLPYVDVLEKTIALMMMCDAAVALGDWQISTGC